MTEAVELYSGQGKRGGVNWNKVAEHVGTRSATQCRLRLRDSSGEVKLYENMMFYEI